MSYNHENTIVSISFSDPYNNAQISVFWDRIVTNYQSARAAVSTVIDYWVPTIAAVVPGSRKGVIGRHARTRLRYRNANARAIVDMLDCVVVVLAISDLSRCSTLLIVDRHRLCSPRLTWLACTCKREEGDGQIITRESIARDISVDLWLLQYRYQSVNIKGILGSRHSKVIVQHADLLLECGVDTLFRDAGGGSACVSDILLWRISLMD